MREWIEIFDESQMIEIHKLMKQEWWCSNRTLEEVSAVIIGSSLAIGVLDDDRSIVAFTRVLTDSTFKAILFDVIVRNDKRKTGLGKEMIQYVINHKALSGVKSIELYCPDHVSPFYKSLGFSVSDSKLHYMKKM